MTAPRMTAQPKIKQLKIKETKASLLRAHYEEVARDTLGILWHQKLLIVGILLAALLFASIFLVLIGPRYTGEATIQLNFIREEPTTGAKTQSIATVDAVALIDSAARVIRSRATANAVVARLGLDKDPDFARESTLGRVLSGVGRALGLEGVTPTPRDLAANQLMRKVTVANEPRSYLISITATTRDPEQAATLANVVALEFLRGQMLQQLADTQAAAARELTQLSSVYGVRHPSYVLARTRLDALQDRLTALRDGPPDDDTVKLVIGQSFVAAEKTFIPSGPPIILILGLTAGAALGVAIWLALRLKWSAPAAIYIFRYIADALRYRTQVVLTEETAPHAVRRHFADFWIQLRSRMRQQSRLRDDSRVSSNPYTHHESVTSCIQNDCDERSMCVGEASKGATA
jgi:capsular polysaccharide biosynthesis protein